MAWKDIPEKKVLATLKDGKSFKGTASEKMTIYVDGGVPGGEGDVQGISVTVDPNTYVMTTQLKDGTGGNVGSPATVDLPLESMVVGGEYDDATKNVILTLKNGETVEFSVADLVAGLQTEITAQNPLSADLVAETTNKNFVSSSEKEDIANIPNIESDVRVCEEQIEDKQDKISVNNPLDASLIDDTNSNQKLVSESEKQALEEITQNDVGEYTRFKYSDSNQTSFVNGQEDKYFTVYPMNNGSDFYDSYGFSIDANGYGLTFTRGESGYIYSYGESVVASMLPVGIYEFDPQEGSQFFIDDNEEYEITSAGNIIISPTNENNQMSVYFIPVEGQPTTYVYDKTNETVSETTGVNETELQEQIDAVYLEMAGKQNQIDANNKLSADYIAETNDNKVMTSAERTKLAGIAAGAEVNVQSNWNEANSSSDAYIQNKPTNVSAFTNDSGYQNASQVSSAIASAVGQITSFEYQVVQTLPQTGEKGVVYLVANTGTTPNIYDEYIWVNNAFEKIGTTDIDLSGYATTQDLEDGLATKADAIDPSDLPSGSTQNGVITTSDHTDIDPSVVDEGQIVVDSTDGKVYIVSEITTDPQTGDPVIVWKEVQTDKEVIYANVTVTDVQTMTFTVSGYTANDICVLLDAGVNVIYRLNLPQALPGLAAGVYDFRPIMHASRGGYGGVMSSMIGPSGSSTILGIASHTDGATSYFEMRYLQNQIDSNNKLSADLIDSSSSDEKTYQTGTGAPTTSTAGSVGEMYVDKSTGTVYVCTSTTGGTYTWSEVSGGGGLVELTSADYDYHASGSTDDGVALWRLEPGVYYTGSGVKVYISDDRYADTPRMYLIGPSFGSGNNAKNITELTAVPTGVSLVTHSVNSSGVLIASKSIPADVPVITMTSTDPGEGASLAANNFIAVYEA